MIEALARRAGLERALEQFPDDVAAAAKSAAEVAERVRKASGVSSDASLEPWPPMRVACE